MKPVGDQKLLFLMRAILLSVQITFIRITGLHVLKFRERLIMNLNIAVSGSVKETLCRAAQHQ
jgi:hypothetical protein